MPGYFDALRVSGKGSSSIAVEAFVGSDTVSCPGEGLFSDLSVMIASGEETSSGKGSERLGDTWHSTETISISGKATLSISEKQHGKDKITDTGKGSFTLNDRCAASEITRDSGRG